MIVGNILLRLCRDQIQHKIQRETDCQQNNTPRPDAYPGNDVAEWAKIGESV